MDIKTLETWLTTRQAAEALGITPLTAQGYASRGPPEDIEAFKADKAARAAHKEQRLYNRMSKAAKAEYDARKAQEAQAAAADNNGVIE